MQNFVEPKFILFKDNIHGVTQQHASEICDMTSSSLFVLKNRNSIMEFKKWILNHQNNNERGKS